MMQRSCIAVSKVHVNVVVEVASFLHSYLAQIIKDMNTSIPPSSSRKKFMQLSQNVTPSRMWLLN